VTHAGPDRPRGWFARLRRRPAADTPVVDLRDPARPTPTTEDAAVLDHLTRLRDAGLITNAELDKERRSMRGTDDGA